MTDVLLPYYNRELAFIRRMGAEFAQSHPKIAGRLRLGAEGSEDPHVSRLIEAFAYISARIRHKVEDDFPEVAEALLGALYPHYLRPIPSMSVVQFGFAPGQGSLQDGYTIERGAAVETEPIDGEPCRFRTTYPVTLWPLEIDLARFRGVPFEAPRTAYSSKAASALRVRLKRTGPVAPLSTLGARSLRFFIKAAPQHAYELYELLFNHARDVVIAAAPTAEPVSLGAAAIKPVGFGLAEGMFPMPPQSFPGFRLLSEFFSFPEKFLFFDIVGLDPRRLQGLGDQMELFIYFDRASSALEENLDQQTLQLGCSPVVNLFRQRAEPIALTQEEHRYRVVPDARRPLATEVYSIDRVIASSRDGQEIECLPFYSFKHAAASQTRQVFWASNRQAAARLDDRVDHGTEVYLSLVDLDFQPASPADWTLDVETTCLSRDLPHRLPYGGGQPRLSLVAGGPISRPVCLTPPTPTFRPPLRHGVLWRLIAHLAFGRLGLLGAEGRHRPADNEDPQSPDTRRLSEGTEALRELLSLYDFADSAETQAIIEGVADLSTRRVVGRTSGGVGRGVEMALTLDEDRYAGAGMFLFATVLEQFFALASSMNSFTQTVLKTKQREGVVRKWPPRAGEQTLL